MKTIVIKDSYCFRIRKDTTDIKSINEVIKRKCYQKKKINFNIEYDDVWLDLGANIGVFTISAAKKCKKVYSYECVKDNFMLLNENVSLNQLENVITSSLAVSHSGLEDKIYLCRGKTNKYEHSLIHWRKIKKETQKIKSIKFSDILDKHKDINCIKMDIEGCEIEILENFNNYKNIKKLVFEYSFNKDNRIFRYEKIIKKLKNHFDIRIVKNMDKTEKTYNHFPSGVISFFKKSKIVDKVVELLKKNTIYYNYNRTNIGKGRSQTLGLVNNYFYTSPHNTKPRICKSVFSDKKPELYDSVFELGKKIVKHNFTSVQVNHNYKCKRHIDGRNVGISTIIGLGNYKGGNLFIEYPDGIKEIDIRNKPYSFNGSKYYHWVSDFEGDRYSLVYFNLN